MQSIDFAAIKAAVTMEKAIKFLGLAGKFEQPTQFRCACPNCKPEGKRELSISTEKNVFRCYAADGRVAGDSIYLVAHVRGIGQRDAAILLRDAFMQEPEKPKPKKRLKRPGNSANDPPTNRRKNGNTTSNAPVGGTEDYSILDHMQHWT